MCLVAEFISGTVPGNTSEKNVITITNSSISGNSHQQCRAADVIKDSEWDTARGGGLYVKSDDASHPLSVTLNDVSFNNNTATSSTGKNVNAYAYGGAVMNRYADLTFNISQDMSYTGNSVHGENAKGRFSLSGIHRAAWLPKPLSMLQPEKP